MTHCTTARLEPITLEAEAKPDVKCYHCFCPCPRSNFATDIVKSGWVLTMRELLTHEEAAAKHGPTQAYLRATQPRWVTAIHRMGISLLVFGAIMAVSITIYELLSGLGRPNLILSTLAAAALGVGALALLPMLIYRADKGLPVVQDGRFVTMTATHIMLAMFAYLVIFGVVLPLTAMEALGNNSPEWLEELARISTSVMTVLRIIF